MTLKGILKKDEIKEITKKDGSIISKRLVYIEPEDSIYPIQVSIENQSLAIGKIGDKVSLEISIYPFYFEEGKIKRANVSYYIPNK
jgi:hypothetical protein